LRIWKSQQVSAIRDLVFVIMKKPLALNVSEAARRDVVHGDVASGATQ